MKGSIQVKNGIWYTVINHKDSDGKYKQKWEATGLNERGNKKEANRLLEERLQAFEENKEKQEEKFAVRAQAKKQTLGTADMRFTDYCKRYLESIKNRISPYLYHTFYIYYIRIYEEYFKDKTVMDITSDVIDDFNDYMRKERGVKNSTLKHYAEVLRPTLKIAYNDKIIPDNPYDNIKKLAKEKYIVNFYNKEELEKLFEAIAGHKLELAFKVLAHYGFRRSELLGIRWKAINFDHNSITINHKVLNIEKKLVPEDKLKTKTSHRTLPLVAHIKEDLLKWKAKIEENKKFFGSSYDDKWQDYVFVNEKGVLYNPDYISHAFNKVLKKHNLKHIRLHDLRHSCASLLLANGINMKQIQDWLGHADFATTADIYSHLDYNSKLQSANVLTKAFGKESEEKQGFAEILQKSMEILGIENIKDYVEFLQSEKAAIQGKNDKKSSKNELEM